MNQRAAQAVTLLCLALVLSACAGAQARKAPLVVVPAATTASSAAAPTPAALPSRAAKPVERGRTGSGARPAITATEQPGTAFLAPEMLGRPTDRSITLNLLPAHDLEAYVEFGPASDAYTGRTPSMALAGGRPSEVTLDGLQPGTLVYYRVRYREPGASEYATGGERSFTTQRAAGSTFTFDVQGDSHPERVNKQFNADLYARTLANAAADRPDFYLTIGDDFSVDNLRAVDRYAVTQLYVGQRQWLGQVGAPVFLVNGNHEQASLANLDGTADNVAVWAQNARYAYFPQPAADGFYSGDSEAVANIGLLRDYYAFTWADALFVIIDPYWHSPETVDNQFGAGHAQKAKRDLWNVTLGDVQYQWFKQTLESSSARYKFVFAHHVNGTGRGGIELAGGYEWGDAAGFPEHRPGWDTPIHQLMVDNSVTIFFQGHDHLFARQELDGVIYQTLPEPANPDYTVENAEAYRSGEKFPNSGHVRVTVSPEQVKVDYVRSYLPDDETGGHQNGEVAYSYTAGENSTSSASPTGRVALPLVTTPSAADLDPATVAPFPGSVVLGRPTDSSATVSLLSNANLEAYVEYGLVSGVYTARSSPITLRAGSPAEVALVSLQPDTAYTYRLRFRAPGATTFSAAGDASLHTQRPPGSTFTFTVDADPHYGEPNFHPEVYSVTLRSVLADRPDFHIDLGDTFMTEKIAPASYEQAATPYRAMRPFFGLLEGSAPLFLVNGNHDGDLGWKLDGTANNLPIWATQARRTFYPNPAPDRFYSGGSAPEPFTGVRDGYYAWTWGDALFVVLDPFWYSTTKPEAGSDNWDVTLGEAQYRWLAQVLKESKAKYKFVFAHNLVGGADQNLRGGIEAADKYEWGGQNADGSWGFSEHRPGWDAPVHQLLVENGATVFFHGHDHLFVKQDLDGIVYQECPQPSYAMYNKIDSAVKYGYTHGDVLGGSGYLRVTVSPAEVKVDYVRSYLPADENAQRRSGDVCYSYIIRAP
jgi:phosphodiesterase/alkaline phosphatase D-like protein